MSTFRALCNKYKEKFPDVDLGWNPQTSVSLDVQNACQPFWITKVRPPSEILEEIKDGDLLSCLRLLFAYDHHFATDETKTDNVGLVSVYRFIQKTRVWQDQKLFRTFFRDGLSALNNVDDLFLVEDQLELTMEILTEQDILNRLFHGKIPIGLMTEVQMADRLAMPPACFALHDMRHATDYLYGNKMVIAQHWLCPTVLARLAEHTQAVTELWNTVWKKLLQDCLCESLNKSQKDLFYMVHELLFPPFRKLLDLVLYRQEDEIKEPFYLENGKVSREFFLWASKKVRGYQKTANEYLAFCNPKGFVDLNLCIPGQRDWMLTQPRNLVVTKVVFDELAAHDSTEEETSMVVYCFSMKPKTYHQAEVEKLSTRNSEKSTFLPSFDSLNHKCDYFSAFVTESTSSGIDIYLFTYLRRELQKDLASAKAKHKRILSFPFSKPMNFNVQTKLEMALRAMPHQIGSILTSGRDPFVLHVQPFTVKDIALLCEKMNLPFCNWKKDGRDLVLHETKDVLALKRFSSWLKSYSTVQ